MAEDSHAALRAAESGAFPLHALLPKVDTQAAAFLDAHPTFDGEDLHVKMGQHLLKIKDGGKEETRNRHMYAHTYIYKHTRTSEKQEKARDLGQAQRCH